MTPQRHFPQLDRLAVFGPSIGACLSLSAALLLSACAERGVDSPALAQLDTLAWTSPNNGLQERLQSVLSTKKSAANAELNPSNWWALLGNADLSALVAQALANNPSLSLAKTRIEKAQSLAGLSRSATLAQGEVGLDLSRQL